MSLHLPHRRASPSTSPPIQNVNALLDKKRTLGQRAADRVALIIGSWPFVMVQSLLLIIWAGVNSVRGNTHWDPYPFILMNLMLSLQAAYTSPLIMMSQGRQAERDRVEAHEDYLVNCKAEAELRNVIGLLETQTLIMNDLQARLERLEYRNTSA